MIYNIYIFDRNGQCIHYGEWMRRNHSGTTNIDEEFKLMFGMVHSLKSFANRLSPVDLQDGFTNFRTSKYRLHLYETASGYKFILNTDIGVSSGVAREALAQIYSSVFVEYVVHNPLCQLTGEPISSDLFKAKLDEFVRALTFFATPPPATAPA